MEIRTSQFDMSDAFAQVKERIAQAETALPQMPPAQRRALLDAMQPHDWSDQAVVVEAAVALPLVAVAHWDGARNSSPQYGAPVPVRRRRTGSQPLPPRPLFWHWIGKADRLQRRLHRQWQHQFQAVRREVRLWLRAVKRRQYRYHRR